MVHRRPFLPVVAIEGPSAAGKTTVVRIVSDLSNGVIIKEAFDRMVPPPELTFASRAALLRIERSLLEEDCLRYIEAREHQRRRHRVWADTDFVGPLTYSWGLWASGAAPWNLLPSLQHTVLERVAKGRWGLADAYVYLDVPSRVRRRRALHDPRGHPPNLWARHERVGKAERRAYVQLLKTILPNRVAIVSGVGTPDRVARRILEAVRKLSVRSRPTRGDSRQVVHSLLELTKT